MGFELAEVAVLKRLDHANITRSLERRRSWREHALQRHANTKHVFPWTITARLKEITQATEDNLHTVCDLLLATNEKYKLVTSGNQAWLYSNSIELINQFSALQILERKTYTQALINRAVDTIILRNSAHTSRSYFRAVKLTAKEAEILRNFLVMHQQNIRLSPALTLWLEDTKLRLNDYFFVDYAGDSWLTMLSLVRPGLVRKSLQIVPAK